jgi:SRSO17 transposase
MEQEDMPCWVDSFAEFCGRFDDLFARSESREQARKYMRGLLAPLERKTSWQLAERLHDSTPDRMQRLLYRVPWDAEEAQDRLQQFIIERFGEKEAIGVLDETGIPKKGTASVGVAKQYCGAVGKLENCQVATLLTYSTSGGHVFLDRRLFLPEDWCADARRRARAKVPKEVRFQTKPEQAGEMLLHAWKMGVPMQWVTGDSVYGCSPQLRQLIEQAGKWYVLAVTSVIRVWRERPEVLEPEEQTGGRPRRNVRLAPGAAKSQTVAEVIAGLPKSRWRRLSIAVGTKGPRLYDWVRLRVIESYDDLPGPEVWLLARRSISKPDEIAYYLAFAPGTISLQTLALIAGTRYTVEQCIEEAKGEVGFDQYEVRHYWSWYRHMTLALMAHTWLAAERLGQREKNAGGSDRRTDRARGASALGGGLTSG